MTFGSEVTFLEADRTQTVRIVAPEEADIEHRRISVPGNLPVYSRSADVDALVYDRMPWISPRASHGRSAVRYATS